MAPAITVLVEEKKFKRLADAAKEAAKGALRALKQNKAAVTIVLSNDKAVKALNHQYRGKNKPTNVLSFENGGVLDGEVQLGDIVLAYETLAREAKAQKKTQTAHLQHLVVHGVLHLLGHDHEDDGEAEAMEAREIAILKRMGIANPYA